ncbi:S8 family serine peptidase [Roseofilum sp. BLCC_M154]|uniref:S8 family serine peptidase n=1 Tax=Roseofilum acuticapitatum BLCC-M154 TaxID=3022444 RepID=A0ABT7ARU7_9CYAN|nr:S8 family serine peptidase [Roseofilum acuticapitatum]MDJ1169632.1 S8 family serine peptidase [Roseofilum acuticapitatum BLCC-M154]
MSWLKNLFHPWFSACSPSEQHKTFILEPILTPSGIVDGLEDTSDLDLDADSTVADTMESELPEALIDDVSEHALDEVSDLPEISDEDFEEIPFIYAENVDDVLKVADLQESHTQEEATLSSDDVEMDGIAEALSSSPQFDSGYFVVGETGEVGVDYLFDGGGYKGELGIFSLGGMEEYDPDTEEFIAEAARRSHSNSELGHIIISDRSEGARFSGELGETNQNSGEYLGVKTFNMNSGDRFGMMLVPKGRVEQVVNNPGIGGAARPLFSLATANPEDGFHWGQIVDVTGEGNTFVFEDLRVDGKSDGDYNDLIFQVRNATGKARLLDEVIDSEQDWRNSDLGQTLIEYTKPYLVVEESGEIELEPITLEPKPIEDKPWEDQVLEDLQDDNPVIRVQLQESESEGLTDKQKEVLAQVKDQGAITIISTGDETDTVTPVITEIRESFDNVLVVGQGERQNLDVPLSKGVVSGANSNFAEYLDVVVVGENGTVANQNAAQVVAEVWQANPSLSYQQVIETVKVTATDLQESGELINPEAAIHLARSTVPQNVAFLRLPENQAPENLVIAGDRFYNAEESIHVFGQVTDGDTAPDLAKVVFSVKQEEEEWRVWDEISAFDVDADAPNTGHFNHNLAGLSPGRYQLKVEAFDHQGAVSNTEIQSFTVLSEESELTDRGRWAIAEAVNLDNYDPEYLNNTRQWVVSLPPDIDSEALAQQLGVTHVGETGSTTNSYIWEFPLGTSPQDVAAQLAEVEGVEYAYPLVEVPLEFYPSHQEVIWQSLRETMEPTPVSERQIHWREAVYDIRQLLSRNENAVQESIAKFFVRTLSGEYGEQPAQALQQQLEQVFPQPQVALEFYSPGSNPSVNLTSTFLELFSFYERPEGSDPVEYADDNFNNEEIQLLNSYQWHLRSGENPDADANITEVYEQYDLQGRDVVIGVIDNGFEVADTDQGRNLATHSDLAANYRADLSYDFDEGDDIPSRVVSSEAVYQGQNHTLGYFGGNSNFIFRNPHSGLIQNATLNLDIDYESVEDLEIYLYWNEESETSPFPVTKKVQVKNAGEAVTPVDLTSHLRGQPASKGWRLEIKDTNYVQGKTGTLNHWSLDLDTVNAHGTAVVGVSSADGNNDLGVNGVAGSSSWAGLRVGGNGTHDIEMTRALSSDWNQIDIYNNSWGLGFFNNPFAFAPVALEVGAQDGRDGFGNIYVFAGGNASKAGGNVNYNAFANSRHTIAVAAIDHEGKQSVYSESGAALLVSAYSDNGTKDNYVGITTTGPYADDGDDTNDYLRGTFGGTSSATPLVSGVVALMLEANPNLTARDVQHILVETAQKNDPDDEDWVLNGAGRWVNHKYGFGAVDALAAVEMAKDWTTVADEVHIFKGKTVDKRIEDNPNSELTSTLTFDASNSINLEWVEVEFDADHEYKGDLEIILEHTYIDVDDFGEQKVTQSVLSEQHFNGQYLGDDNSYKWRFTSARHWGEPSTGEWRLKVRDKNAGNDSDLNEWDSWKLNLYGQPPIYRIGEEFWFEIDTPPSSRVLHLSVEALSNSEFAINWNHLSRFSQDENGDGIYSQRYDRNGVFIDREFQADVYNQQGPVPFIMGLKDDKKIFTLDYNNYNNSNEIIVALWDRYNNSVGERLNIPYNPSQFDVRGDVVGAALNDKDFVVSWSTSSPDNNTHRIYAQRFRTSG